MTTTANSHLQTYDAYNSQRGLVDDSEFTRVGRGTPGGEFLRRYWLPVAYEQEVTDLPLKVRVLGEDLVVFRNGRGEYGLVEQRCSHRGASLEYGVISDEGIRCAYHGFHYAPDGTILATGSGAPMANAGKLCHGAYPVYPFHGLIFAYMGPPEKKPLFPMLDLYNDPNLSVEPGFERGASWDCNWMQINENAMDPVHTSWLHVVTTGTQRGFSDDVGIVPVLQWVMTDFGMQYIACRRVNDFVWVRVVDKLMPTSGLVAASDARAEQDKFSQPPNHCTFIVPIDDYNTRRLYFLFNEHRNPLQPVHRMRGFAQANDRSYEERQRRPGDYDVMTSQGPIAVRQYENLTTTDTGVIMLRNMILDGIRAVQEGRDPVGVNRDPNKIIHTRAQNTVLRVPPADTPEADEELLKELGRNVAAGEPYYRLQAV